MVVEAQTYIDLSRSSSFRIGLKLAVWGSIKVPRVKIRAKTRRGSKRRENQLQQSSRSHGLSCQRDEHSRFTTQAQKKVDAKARLAKKEEGQEYARDAELARAVWLSNV